MVWFGRKSYTNIYNTDYDFEADTLQSQSLKPCMFYYRKEDLIHRGCFIMEINEFLKPYTMIYIDIHRDETFFLVSNINVRTENTGSAIHDI